MPHDTMTEIIDTLTELKRMNQLNAELLEQLSVSCNWLLEHDIPVPNKETLVSLVNKALALISEIQAENPRILQYQKLPNESLHEPSNKRRDYRTFERNVYID